MQNNVLDLFRLVDALKRLHAAYYKGALSQKGAIVEYDRIRAEVESSNPAAFGAYLTMFDLVPEHTGTIILRG